jgi:hypothetical protein
MQTHGSFPFPEHLIELTRTPNQPTAIATLNQGKARARAGASYGSSRRLDASGLRSLRETD